MGETFDLFSLGGEPREKNKYYLGADEPEPIFLVPSASYDFRVISPLGSGKCGILYSSSALSAAKFLTEVRGLPLSDFEVECEGCPFRILRKNGRCGVVTNRFSVISSCSESIRFAELKTGILRTPLGKIKVCEVCELCGFRKDVLPELTLSHSGENVVASLAFDKRGRDINVVSHFCRSFHGADGLVSAIAVASYLCSLGMHSELSVFSNGAFFDIEPSEQGFLVFDRHPRPLTLYAPDME